MIQHGSGLAHLRRFELRQVTLGDQHWDSLPGFVLDAPMDAYPPDIDGVLGVLAPGGTTGGSTSSAESSAGASKSLLTVRSARVPVLRCPLPSASSAVQHGFRIGEAYHVEPSLNRVTGPSGIHASNPR